MQTLSEKLPLPAGRLLLPIPPALRGIAGFPPLKLLLGTWSAFRVVLTGYGSFFGLKHPLGQFLLLAASLLHPFTGLAGLLCGSMVMFFRHLLQFSREGDQLDIVNGLLLGMLIGSLYSPSAAYFVLLLTGALLVVLSSAALADVLGRLFRLPVLGMPYVMSAYLLLPLMSMLSKMPVSMAALHLEPLYVVPTLPVPPALDCLYSMPLAGTFSALGSMYFSGTPLGGILVFSAFLVSSRYLCLLAFAAATIAGLTLNCLGIYGGSLTYLVAQMNAVLAACVLGGLYTVPSRLSFLLALFVSALTAAFSVVFEHLLYGFSLPPLAVPFVFTTYLALTALSPQRGGMWLKLWLLTPQLPEVSMEQIAVAQERGLDLRSVSLVLPVKGSWQVYQGFDGPLTHKGAWRYALDLFQTIDGRSFRGSGADLHDYHCFGKPVLSPCYGRVVDLFFSLPDNQPGEVNTVNNWGNYVLIELPGGAHVLLAHLQKDSVRVPLHAWVVPGQMLALCGNSGRSPQPHLHMHVQASAKIGANTVPFHLSNVLLAVEGTEARRYTLNLCPAENACLTSPKRNVALKKALRLSVGHWLDYEVQTALCGGYKQRLTVNLDLSGQFYLESSGARIGASQPRRVAFTLSDDLLACFGREGGRDALLDAFALAVGLTPLAEGALTWQDKIPQRLLPRQWWLRHLSWLAAACSESHYKRVWDSRERLWMQTGEHRLTILGFLARRVYTEARLSEQGGLISLVLWRERGCLTFCRQAPAADKQELVLAAALSGYGVREDNGIPAVMALRG